MAKAARFNGPYEHMDFPDYVFVEYPKQLTLGDGSTVVANSQRHELELLSDDASSRVYKPSEAEVEAGKLADQNAKLQAELESMRAQMAELMAKSEAQVDIAEPEGKALKSGSKLADLLK